MSWRRGDDEPTEGGLDDLFSDERFQQYDDSINPFVAPPTAPVPLPPVTPAARVEPPAPVEPPALGEPAEARHQSWRDSLPALPPEDRGPIHDRFSPTVAMPVAPTSATTVLPSGMLPGAAAGAIPSAQQHAPAAASPTRMGGHWAGLGTAQRVLVGVAGGAMLALMLAGLYTLGTTLGGPTDAAATAVGDGAGAAASVTSLEPGTHPWSALQGGECLDGLDTVWADEFTVVSCDEPHAAQFMYRGDVGPEVTVYLDAEGWRGLTTSLCDASELLDFGAASAYTDLQWQITYAGDATEWANGDRSYSCFVSRASGEPLEGSLLAAP